MKHKSSAPVEESTQVVCGVPWCIGLTDDGAQYCRVHRNEKLRTQFPPPIQRELELKFVEAMRGTPARNVDARR